MAANLAKKQRFSDLYRSLNRREKNIAKQEADILRKLIKLEDSIINASSGSTVTVSPSKNNFSKLLDKKINRIIADFDFNNFLFLSEGV